jgi:hypothetical protein
MANITIIDRHLPALPNGKYEIVVSQNFSAAGNQLQVPVSTLFFLVEAEQFTLSPLQVDSVFPTAGNIGDFSLSFPHIVFNRSTLPWERQVAPVTRLPVAANQSADTNKIPWLALVLLAEDEIDHAGKASVLSIAKSAWLNHVDGQPFTENPKEGDKKEEHLSVIVADKDFLKNTLLPSLFELQYLAHVRVDGASEKSVLVCNRLPQRDKRNVVHLVSLENCFEAAGSFIGKSSGEADAAIVSLKSWEFYCNDHFLISAEALTLYKTLPLVTGELIAAVSKITGKEYFNSKDLVSDLPHNITREQLDQILKTFRIGHLPDILKHLNSNPGTLRPNDTQPHSRLGYKAFQYQTRSGKLIQALYRSPLVPVFNLPADDSPYPYAHSDEAFRYFTDAQMMDVSYASAWEIGRLSALQNRSFSIALFQWKRACYQMLKLGRPTTGVKEVPAVVQSWFTGVMNNLGSIPFNYLVPDPSFIPFESIRFFTVDQKWLSHFVDGAFSIGRLSSLEKNFDRQLYARFDFLKPDAGIRSGFLLHSVAVAGWPDMVIYDTNDANVPYLKQRLSPNLMLCLFTGQLSVVTLYQKPQSLHFGVDMADVKTVGALLDGKRPVVPTDGDVSHFAADLLQEIPKVSFKVPSKS